MMGFLTPVMRWIKSWGGLNPQLPSSGDVENPTHGQAARNKRGQKVLYDAVLGSWVMPQNLSNKPPVTITRNE